MPTVTVRACPRIVSRSICVIPAEYCRRSIGTPDRPLGRRHRAQPRL